MSTCPQCHGAFDDASAVCPNDGTPLAGFDAAQTLPASSPTAGRSDERTDPLLGSTLAGRYHVLRRLGEGGMGVVYEATHAVIGRTVAVKVLRERFVERPEVAARLMNEARLASSIHNEHIVDIFDFGETSDGRTFVVMERLDGESLAQLLRCESPLPEPRALALCLQVCDALGAAHERGIIHRDVKPENVFVLRRDGLDFAKVLDFGISKATRPGDDEAQQRLTHTGMVLGTPLYMSPEQARGEEAIDHRIDVYALGVILYEALTGQVPFRGSNYLGIISDVLSRSPTPLRQVRPDLGISEAAEQLVARAMAKDREARYRSMAELGEDLRRALEGRAVAVLPAQATAAARRRRRALVAAIVAIALGVVGVTAALTRTGAEPRSPVAAPLAAPTPAAPPVAPPPAARAAALVDEPAPERRPPEVRRPARRSRAAPPPAAHGGDSLPVKGIE